MTSLRDEPSRRRKERPLPRYPILGLASLALLSACQPASEARAPAHSSGDTEGAEELGRTESTPAYWFEEEAGGREVERAGAVPPGWREVEELRGPRARSETGPRGDAGAAGGPSPGPDELPGP